MTKTEILKKSVSTIKNKRAIKVLGCQNYKQNCYSNPEILKLANALGNLKINIAKFENENKDTTALKAEKAELLKKFLLTLKQDGKDVEKVIPKYDCKICLDQGFKENGEMCECLKSEFCTNLMKETGLDLSKVPTLDEINTSVYQNKDEIENIIKNLQNIKKTKFNTILFSGATGTGKTFLSKCFAKSACQNQILTRFYSSSEINKLFCQAHFHIDKLDSILFDLIDPEVLIIDDFGAEAKYKNITTEYFLNLLNERQSKNKITLITTNLTLNDIKQTYNERFLSRILDKEISLKYNFQGKDLRI